MQNVKQYKDCLVRELTVSDVLAFQSMDFYQPLVVDYFLSNIVISGDYSSVDVADMIRETNPDVSGKREPDVMEDDIQEQRRKHATKQLTQQVLSVMRDYPNVLDMPFSMYITLIESLQ